MLKNCQVLCEWPSNDSQSLVLFLFAGSRKERTVLTVQNIGPAVLNGGFSTFLALALLATSKSHVFSSFFKVSFKVALFFLFYFFMFVGNT